MVRYLLPDDAKRMAKSVSKVAQTPRQRIAAQLGKIPRKESIMDNYPVDLATDLMKRGVFVTLHSNADVFVHYSGHVNNIYVQGHNRGWAACHDWDKQWEFDLDPDADPEKNEEEYLDFVKWCDEMLFG